MNSPAVEAPLTSSIETPSSAELSPDLSPEAIEERVLELQEKKKDLLVGEILTAHQIPDLNSLKGDERTPVIVEKSRRIMGEIIEPQHNALIAAKIDAREGESKQKIEEYFRASQDWANKLDKYTRQSMFAEMVKEEVTTKPAEEIKSPEVVVETIEVKEGESLWDILRREFTKVQDYNSLSLAGQTYVLMVMGNKILEDGKSFGINNPYLSVGEKLDLSSIMGGDKSEVEGAIYEALRLTDERKKLLMDSYEHIKEWLDHNPSKEITPDVVPEILAGEAEKVEIETAPSISGAELSAEIREAKGEKEKEVFRETPLNGKHVLEELPANRSMMGDFFDHQKVEESFRGYIDKIYSKRALLGLKKIDGVESSDWLSVKNLPAKKFLDFFTHNSSESDLAPGTKQILTDVPNHAVMANEINELVHEAGGNILPYENETVEVFVKRLGAFIMKSHLDKEAGTASISAANTGIEMTA